MSYTTLAPHYHWLETLTFGRALQAARCACLQAGEEVRPQRALLLGDGDGRFLERALRCWPEAVFTSVDQSEGMLQRARKRCGDERVRYVRGDVLDALTHEASGAFDVVASHFFLDCFPEASLGPLLSDVQRVLRPGGRWFISDFRDDRLWQRVMLSMMYRGFHLLTGDETPAKRLPDHGLALEALGAKRERLGSWRGGFVVAEQWVKTSPIKGKER